MKVLEGPTNPRDSDHYYYYFYEDIVNNKRTVTRFVKCMSKLEVSIMILHIRCRNSCQCLEDYCRPKPKSKKF